MYEQTYHTADLSNSTFLVTGGAGFIGSNIVEYLLKYNAGKVRVLDNFATGKRKNLEKFLSAPNFELIEGDIRDVETCKKSVEGIAYITHQAALGSVPRSIQDPITTNETNISGFLNLLQAAKEANVKRFVYAASSSTYGDSKELPKVEDRIGRPLSPYAITKYVNELYANVFSDLYGFHSVGLRYFNVFGPKQSPNGAYAAVIPLFFKAVLEGNSPVLNGNGQQTRDFTFVENAVQANIKGFFSQNITRHEVFNIAVGERTSLVELWQHVTNHAGSQLPPTFGPARLGDIQDSLANIEKAAQLLGYQPLFNISQGLAITYDWYKSQFPAILSQ